MGFSGMFFTLKKRERGISEDDTDRYKFTVLGYYDGLDIRTIDNWYDLSPNAIANQNLLGSLDTPFIEQYTIRALMPENRDELDKEGFAYGFWEKAGRKSAEQYVDYEQNVRTQFPFAAMSVINLTENFVKQCSDVQEIRDKFLEILKKGVAQAGSSLKELHCAVFTSLGYSDFVIMFLSDDLAKVANIISYMRGAVEGETIVISSSYTVCALDRNYYSNMSLKNNPNMKIDIRISLREGISPIEFLHLLQEEVRNAGEEDSFVEEVAKHYDATFGNSDCFLLPDQSLDCYLKWHKSGQLLNPGCGFFQSYIANVRTSVRVNGFPFEAGDVSKSCSAWKNVQEVKDRFRRFVSGYDKFLIEKNISVRSSKAIQQTMKKFVNITRTRHSFDVEHVIENAFEALIANVNYYISPDAETQKKNADILDAQQLCAVEALDMFNEYIGEFLSNLIQSDRPFVEGNSLTHSGIGNATKMLFAYSALLEKLTIQDHAEKDFVFVVLSGGFDCTEAIDLFSFARKDDNIKKIIIIKIPEMGGLYDLQGTLFRILHEYRHYIGDRKRKERFSFLTEAVAGHIADEMLKFEFSAERLQTLKENALEYLTGSLKAEVEQELDNAYQDEKERTGREIKDTICRHGAFDNYAKSDNDEDYYEDTLRAGIFSLQSIAELFCTQNPNFAEEPKDNLQRKLYDIFYAEDKRLISSIVAMFERMIAAKKGTDDAINLRIPLQKFQWLWQHYMFMDANPQEYDVKIKKWVERYLGALLQNYPLNHEEKGDYSQVINYTDMLDTVLYAMAECFSDGGAIRTIGMEVEDFLLAFIYELWDIEQAFPLVEGNILRIGADLKVLYGIEGDALPEKVKQSVRNKVRNRGKQGYEYRNVDKMLKRIDEILEQYRSSELDGIRSAVERYLDVCISAKDWENKEMVELYKLCDFDTSHKTYQVADQIICVWKNLGKGEGS